MDLTNNSLRILEERYLLKDENGRVIESPREMFGRIARSIAAAEEQHGADRALWEEKFFDILSDLRFLPNSPTLMNAGKPRGQLAACFVLPVDDSMHGIFETLKNAAMILQSGGGTGFSFSNLRPRNDIVRSTGGTASGPVSFIRIYNTATDVVKQGGARRGANMGILRVDHPDILEFIRVKRLATELANFNISVAVTDEFMEALARNTTFPLTHPHSGKERGRLRAREVFAEIVESAWQTGDPGLVFIDRINRANPTPNVGVFESTNPCGEQPLLPYEACVLGSINVSRYTRGGEIDFPRLERDVRTAVRFLDDAIDVNAYPIEAIELAHRGNRKIGLGIMGWADLLVLMGIPYDDPAAFALARRVMRYFCDVSRDASRELAEKRGVFPNFAGSVWSRPGMPRVRNATTTTIAPTGTISTIAGCSSGIEPYFALAYRRLVLDTEMEEVNRLFVETATREGFWSEELMREVERKGTLRGVRGVPQRVKRLFRTSHEIAPEHHIEMQAAFQEYTDNAVSKTINLPRKATRQEVEKAFLLAYRKGCKGVTVFRYLSRKGTLVKVPDVG